MENRLSKLVRTGGSNNGAMMIRKLPPGFRFQPTDEELVFQYLKCKILCCPLPASIIPQLLNICNHDPWDLPGNPREERYFFSKKEGDGKKRGNRVADSGYWKATGADKQIIMKSNCNSNNSGAVGMKKTLVFYAGKPPRRTHWVMHEYRLLPSSSSSSSASDFPQGEVERWVLCRVFCRRRKLQQSGNYISDDDDCEVIDNYYEANCNYDEGDGRRRRSLFIDFMGKLDGISSDDCNYYYGDSNSPSSSSSSLSSCCSSSITRMSSTGIGVEEEDGEEQSSINFF